MNTRKLMKVEVSDKVIIDVLQEGSLFKSDMSCTQGLPKDSMIIDIRRNPNTASIELIVCSDSFKEIPEGDYIPSLLIMFKQNETKS